MNEHIGEVIEINLPYIDLVCNNCGNHLYGAIVNHAYHILKNGHVRIACFGNNYNLDLTDIVVDAISSIYGEGYSMLENDVVCPVCYKGCMQPLTMDGMYDVVGRMSGEQIRNKKETIRELQKKYEESKHER